MEKLFQEGQTEHKKNKRQKNLVQLLICLADRNRHLSTYLCIHHPSTKLAMQSEYYHLLELFPQMPARARAGYWQKLGARSSNPIPHVSCQEPIIWAITIASQSLLIRSWSQELELEINLRNLDVEPKYLNQHLYDCIRCPPWR